VQGRRLPTITRHEWKGRAAAPSCSSWRVLPTPACCSRPARLVSGALRDKQARTWRVRDLRLGRRPRAKGYEADDRYASRARAAVARSARSLLHEGNRRLLGASGVAGSLTAPVTPTPARDLRGRRGRCSLTERNTSREFCCGVRRGPRPRCGFSIGRMSEKGHPPTSRRVSRLAPGHRDISPGRSCGTSGAGSFRERCPHAAGVPARGAACDTRSAPARRLGLWLTGPRGTRCVSPPG
jgi:hypothetical protein